MEGHSSRPSRAESEPARLTDEDRRRIADRALEIAVELFGKAKITTATYARFGRNSGSLKVNFAGKHKGTWFDDPDSGDMISLIQRETGCSFSDAREIALKERAPLPVRRQAAPVKLVADPSIFARQQWTEAQPVMNSLGAAYLIDHRGIPAQVVQRLAHVLRFHPAHKTKPETSYTVPALLIAATDLNRKLHGFQAVRLQGNGKKLEGVGAKLSAGSLRDNHAIGWLSQAEADVIVAEGPEDAITVYAARPDAMVGAAFGGMKRLVDSVPTGRRIIIAAQNDDPDSKAAKSLKAACELLTAAGHDLWIARPPAGIKDANDLLRLHGPEAVRAMLDNAQPVNPPDKPKGTDRPEGTDTAADLSPYWPATDTTATEAYAALQIAIEDWMTATEAHNEAARYAAYQRSILIRSDMTDDERKDGKRELRRMVRARYPNFDPRRPPRLQVAGAAGLGKSSGVREAYLRHPKLWDFQLHAFFPTVALARGFEEAMREASLKVFPAPLVVLHRGRDHEAEIGNAPCVRWRAGRKLAGKVPSLFSAMCKRGESMCPHFASCPYISNYLDQGPGMHLFVHDHLTLSKPMNFPKADLAIIDEDSTQTLLSFGTIGASVLTEPGTYQTASLTGEQDEAARQGNRLMTALTSGRPLLAAIRDAGFSVRELKTLAAWAEPIEEGPEISPGMSDSAIEEAAERIQHHPGAIVGRIIRQLAKELKHDREMCHGVEYKEGELHLSRHAIPTAVPKGVPLLIIDADADLPTNRILFGENLNGRTIAAKRLGRVVQVKNATLAKSYIAPEVAFKEPTERQLAQAQGLRGRILAWIGKLAEGGKKVLVVTNKPVRVTFTGEGSGKIPVSTEFGGATWTHYGAILGIDAWKDYDSVVLIGREEMSAQAAERQARAIHCNEPAPLALTGEYRKVTRCHRMRDGSAVPVEVYEHEDSRVQVCTEAKRERGMCQALDRLRLIHGRADREVFILCSLPLPGIEVDKLVTLDDLISGGSPLEQLVQHARNVWGVLPLSAEFIAAQAPHIATSERTAKRLIAEFKRAKSQIEYYLSVGPFKSVKFWLPKQRRPSVAAFFGDTPNGLGIAALERLFGSVTVQVSSQDEEGQPARPLSADPLEAPPDPAAIEPDEPAIREHAAEGRRMALDTVEGMKAAVVALRRINGPSTGLEAWKAEDGAGVCAIPTAPPPDKSNVVEFRNRW